MKGVYISIQTKVKRPAFFSKVINNRTDSYSSSSRKSQACHPLVHAEVRVFGFQIGTWLKCTPCRVANF